MEITLPPSSRSMTYFESPGTAGGGSASIDPGLPPVPPKESANQHMHLQISNPLKWIKKLRHSKTSTAVAAKKTFRGTSVDRNHHELFQIDSPVASMEDLHLEQIEDSTISEHVSCVWTSKDLTSKQKQYIKSKGLKISNLPKKVFVGDRHVACNRVRLNELGIEFIVNCTHSTPCLFEEEAGGISEQRKDRFRYCRVPLSDDMQENLLIHLDAAHDFINACVSDDHFNASSRNLLIHCSYGVSRSASVCISWMMATLGMSLREAIVLVTSRRSRSKPNKCFMVQLMQYEATLFGPENVTVRETDFEPCVICLSEKLSDAKSPLQCGHIACEGCLSKGIKECTHCAFARQYASSMND